MADVDLIPADYPKLQLVRRRIRQLLIAAVAVAAAVGGVRLALIPAMSFERQNIAHLEKEGLLSARIAAEAERFRLQKTLVEKQLAELDELRGRDRLRLLLQAIDAAWSADVWLDEMRYVGNTRREGAAGNLNPATASAPVNAAQREPREQRFEITGHATSHTELAEFMRRLGSQPGIADVRLQDTGLGSYRDRPVIDASLLLVVDDRAGKPR